MIAIKDIKLEMAPLEGVTDSPYRQIHARHFTQPNKYFMPFISPTQDHILTSKMLRQIAPEYNEGINAVPQLIGHNADDFIWAANEIKAMGYNEVNLNLGCPSPTVTKKRKGAGMLGDLRYLKGFLDDIFDKSKINISIKTRAGRFDLDESEELSELFSQYPVSELIVHPRLEKDKYNSGTISVQSFDIFRKHNNDNICFNGDLFNCKEVLNFAEEHSLNSIMCGRGFISNPKLASEINGENPLSKIEFVDFYTDLFESTAKRIGAEKQILLHMKEYWTYWKCSFIDNDNRLKYILKSKNLTEYNSSVASFFSSADINENAGFNNK